MTAWACVELSADPARSSVSQPVPQRRRRCRRGDRRSQRRRVAATSHRTRALSFRVSGAVCRAASPNAAPGVQTDRVETLAARTAASGDAGSPWSLSKPAEFVVAEASAFAPRPCRRGFAAQCGFAASVFAEALLFKGEAHRRQGTRHVRRASPACESERLKVAATLRHTEVKRDQRAATRLLRLDDRDGTLLRSATGAQPRPIGVLRARRPAPGLTRRPSAAVVGADAARISMCRSGRTPVSSTGSRLRRNPNRHRSRCKPR